MNCVFTTSPAFNLRKDVLPSNQLSNLIYEFECWSCKSRYVGRTAQRLSSRIRQHVSLHLLAEDARAERPTRGRPRLAPEEGNLATVQMADTTDSAADETVQAAAPEMTATAAATTAAPPPRSANAAEVATAVTVSATTTCIMDAAFLNTPDITDETIPGALEEKNEVVRTTRASLPGACKETSSSQPQSRGKSRPSSRQRKTVAAKGKISAEVIADVTSVDKRKERPSLQRAAKTQSLEQEKKPEKKAEDYESSVARHLVRNDVCARA